MNIETLSLGNEYNFKQESDIVEVFSTFSGLRIIISTWVDSINTLLIEVFFNHFQAYRFLDEGDLIAYWESGKFDSSYHVYEVTSGGWISGEALQPGILSISSSVGLREWFIATTNGCMTVVAGNPPSIRELKK